MTLLENILHNTEPFLINEILVIVSYFTTSFIKIVVFLPDYKHKSSLLFQFIAQGTLFVSVCNILRDLEEILIRFRIPGTYNPLDLIIAETFWKCCIHWDDLTTSYFTWTIVKGMTLVVLEESLHRPEVVTPNIMSRLY